MLGDIKALQFELWHNCNNNCDFCYLKEGRVISTPEQQVENIKKVRNILKSSEMASYNALALIGGEFFQGQMNKEVKEEFHRLINNINSLFSMNIIKELWLTASLIDKNQDDLWEVLAILPKNKRILLCTSYDTIGRFKLKEQEEQWFENVKKVCALFPHITAHTEIIITQAFINAILEDTTFLKRIRETSLIDFKFPVLFDKDFFALSEYTQTSVRECFENSYSEFPDNFFISNRNSLLKCLQHIANICGIDRVYYMQTNLIRCNKIYRLPMQKSFKDIWDPNNTIENAPCGHPWISFTYLNSNSCIRCDVLKFYKELING